MSNSPDYSLRQKERDAEYVAACKDWVKTASSEDLEKAREAGVVREVQHRNGKRELVASAHDELATGRMDGDKVHLGREEDLVVALDRWNEEGMFVEVDFAGRADMLPDLLQERFGVTSEQATGISAMVAGLIRREVSAESGLMLRRAIGFFLLPGNLLVRAHALAHAARMAAASGFRSLRHSAQECGVSPEAVRKVAWTWVKVLNLPPLEGAKSDEARARYRKDKQTNHWRNQKCKTGCKLTGKKAGAKSPKK